MKRRRVNIECIWGYENGATYHCRSKEYSRGFCKKHYMEKFRVTRKKCFISSCELDRDTYKDIFCSDHGKENGRPVCKQCDNNVWNDKSLFCKKHDPRRQCKRCSQWAFKEHFGFYFCADHYPEKRECIHTVLHKCTAMWYSDVDHGDTGLCRKHGDMNKPSRPIRYKFKGRCSCTIKESNKCRRRATSGNDQVCARHKLIP
jgi:hypothetical protein